MKKYYSKKINLLNQLSLKSISKSVNNTFFPLKFENEKIEKLHQFVSKNDGDAEHWELSNILGEFINILKDFNQDDFRYFFKTVKFWNSYHLVIIADKFLDNNVKASIQHDLGAAYCKIFCVYEKFDPYFLIDSLEIAVEMYNSKLDLNILVDLTIKLQMLFKNKQITKQQFEHNIQFINKLQNEL
ncbi:hypothetical protein [Chryseobacterium oryctis]|uniref:Uncharacterized protein n=1 Tax=Chryseobacterium oryctis TaxID=2952618 RepID=A0ABT3HMQ8_9FLAO|nr:hypothetical protein [Chryseobacterium oryctis]MCW3161070.1 hypothetical protein [Chryseobacterium oryctis]